MTAASDIAAQIALVQAQLAKLQEQQQAISDLAILQAFQKQSLFDQLGTGITTMAGQVIDPTTAAQLGLIANSVQAASVQFTDLVTSVATQAAPPSQ